MYIVHIVRQFHPGVGGLESAVLELAIAQIVAGHRVRVVTLNRLFDASSDERLPAVETVAGIEVIRIPYFGSSRYPLAWSALGHIKGADVVHVHAIDFFFDYLAWTKPIHQRKLIASTHGGFFHTEYAAFAKRLWFSTITRLSMTWYEGVAAVSASDYEQFRRIRPTGLLCIENGAAVSKFHNVSSRDLRKSIISIGRFSENKRLDLLIGFFQALWRRDSEWKLTIAGRPSDLQAEDIFALVDAAHLRGAVQIVASPSDEQVKVLMGRCSFVASASEYEGFGIAAVEGMSAGLFPLLSDIPPFRQLVTRTKIGMILDFSKSDRSALRVLDSWEHISRRYVERRIASMNAASSYDWRHVAKKYEKLYEAVIGMQVRTILEVPVQVRTFNEAADMIDSRFDKGEQLTVAFANAHTLNVAAKNSDFRRALQNSIVFNDGVGMDIAGKILYGARFRENLNGTDFVPNYLRHTRHRYKVFLLGARPGVAERAAHRLSILNSNHRIVGCQHGHFEPGSAAEIAELIRKSEPDVLLVAMGNPNQELFLHAHLAATGCTLGIGVGALFDFLAGEVPRAGSWIQKVRLEWVFRLAQEPGRLARRYLLGNPLFICRVLVQWWSGSRVQSAAPRPDFGSDIQASELAASAWQTTQA